MAVAAEAVASGAARQVAFRPGYLPGPPPAASDQVIDVDRELAYWREHYRSLPAYLPVWSYEDIEPALKLGFDAYVRQPGHRFEEIAPHLKACYSRLRGLSRLEWSDALPFTAAAWAHLYERGSEPSRLGLGSALAHRRR